VIVVSYVSIAEVRGYTGLTSSQISDLLLQDFIDAAEEYVDSYCGTTFKTATSEDVIDGDDSLLIILDNQPIISITTLKYSLDEGSNYTTLSSDFYMVKDWCIKLKSRCPISGYGVYWKVNYTYGHAAVPDSIKKATLDIAGMYCTGYVFDKTATADSLKLGDATIYKKDYNKVKSNVFDSAERMMSPYVYCEVSLVR
jgi:hypothetical protein